jgi:hypothetical protein
MGPWQGEEDMAGSGPGAFIGGWSSGAGAYTRAQQRRDDFLADHPSWTITYNRETDAHDAVETQGSSQRQITEKSLGSLMDKLEALYETETGA